MTSMSGNVMMSSAGGAAAGDGDTGDGEGGVVGAGVTPAAGGEVVGGAVAAGGDGAASAGGGVAGAVVAGGGAGGESWLWAFAASDGTKRLNEQTAAKPFGRPNSITLHSPISGHIAGPLCLHSGDLCRDT